jgi:hypothetical protein
MKRKSLSQKHVRQPAPRTALSSLG